MVMLHTTRKEKEKAKGVLTKTHVAARDFQCRPNYTECTTKFQLEKLYVSTLT